MHTTLKDISITGIISPGQVYLFSEDYDRGWQPNPMDMLYTITKNEEILPALEMEICIYLSADYELRKFLGWEKISDDCYAFNTLCYYIPDEEETELSYYLQRVFSFEEMLQDVIELFSK